MVEEEVMRIVASLIAEVLKARDRAVGLRNFTVDMYCHSCLYSLLFLFFVADLMMMSLFGSQIIQFLFLIL